MCLCSLGQPQLSVGYCIFLWEVEGCKPDYMIENPKQAFCIGVHTSWECTDTMGCLVIKFLFSLRWFCGFFISLQTAFSTSQLAESILSDISRQW